MDAFGQESIANLMPLVVNVLENLDSALSDNQVRSGREGGREGGDGEKEGRRGRGRERERKGRWREGRGKKGEGKGEEEERESLTFRF